jgi:dipeptidyl aminopeptidase/acylaminoacyl peptidase
MANDGFNVCCRFRAGKSVEFVTMRHEDHWLSHGETRLQMLEACVAFLKKYNPPN